MLKRLAAFVANILAKQKPTPEAEENRAHKFIVVGGWPLSNVVMASLPEQASAFGAASDCSLNFKGVEFIVYERRGSVQVCERPFDSEDGESMGGFDDEPEPATTD